MKILFVSSQNSKFGLSPIIKNQGNSLVNCGVSVSYFGIKGKGIFGYLSNVKKLRIFLRKQSFDVIHSHYSFSAIVASLSGAKPMVVSLMGSDIKSGFLNRLLIRFFALFLWKKVIVKSKDSYNEIYFPLLKSKLMILPNGVDFNRFHPMKMDDCKRKLGLDLNKRYILFGANPDRPVKNFHFAKTSFELIQEENLELIYLKNISHELIPIYLNAASVVILTSLWEGSPNIIKEALACKRPIVSTNCGDVKANISGIEGCFLVENYSTQQFSNKIKEALNYEQTSAREKITHLDDRVIGGELIKLYKSVC
jgi:teichuronic acid biosynthesis glycosyltransferase TuaC